MDNNLTVGQLIKVLIEYDKSLKVIIETEGLYSPVNTNQFYIGKHPFKKNIKCLIIDSDQ